MAGASSGSMTFLPPSSPLPASSPCPLHASFSVPLPPLSRPHHHIKDVMMDPFSHDLRKMLRVVLDHFPPGPVLQSSSLSVRTDLPPALCLWHTPFPCILGPAVPAVVRRLHRSSTPELTAPAKWRRLVSVSFPPVSLPPPVLPPSSPPCHPPHLAPSAALHPDARARALSIFGNANMHACLAAPLLHCANPPLGRCSVA